MRYLIVLISLFAVINIVWATPVVLDNSTIGNSSIAYNDSITIQGEIDVPCLDDSDCGRGSCVDEICQCPAAYTTTKPDRPCEYKRRDTIVAFLWAFFLGSFGANWFYLARGDTLYIILGVVKLCLLGLGCCDSKERYHSINSDGSQTTIIKENKVPAGLWWLIDWILILAGVYNDGNGIGLK